MTQNHSKMFSKETDQARLQLPRSTPKKLSSVNK